MELFDYLNKRVKGKHPSISYHYSQSTFQISLLDKCDWRHPKIFCWISVNNQDIGARVQK